jgi:hypothetical protein
MELNRRALYNSLRMNWVLNPTLEVKTWQVEDYRAMPLDQLFERLEDMDIRLDKASLAAFADSVDNPEDLAEALLHDSTQAMDVQDQVYLILFELWRRLLPEKPCLSILCDEIDYQIHLYDQEQASNNEGMTDALADLQVVLDENIDAGADPHAVFDCINAGCANDLEGFLHDFISDQIDDCNYSYASELLEGFSTYLSDVKWSEFLRARLVAISNPTEANAIVKQLVNGKNTGSDLEFNLEVLSFLVSFGERETFERLLKRSADLLQLEDDFQAMLSIAADFYHRLDAEEIEKSLQSMLEKREKQKPDQFFDKKDPDLVEFFKIIASHKFS